ncbi:MAG TPA: acyltransferase family protein [Pseudolysinimonas sp.]|nr:acyltransferase family protein [Pseudolysinimonas sp.]
MTPATQNRSTPTPAPKPEPGAAFRVNGLDGIRAIAVVLVIVFHLGPGAVVGGYLGVDVFFVVSGFLITTLLLREREASGRVRLGAFWARRARRLLPALAVLVLVCSTAAYLVGGDVLVGLGRQVLGAATFSTNWLLVASGSGYFGDGMPELFRNLWSLAVEEQFYLVWPLLLVLVLLRMPAWLRVALAALLAAASAAAMWLLVDPAATDRVYYGTDTHAFGLAIGAGLAFAAVHLPTAAARWPRAIRAGMPPLAALALAGLIALAFLMPGDALVTFRGGLLLVTVLTAVAIAGLLVPGGWLGRLLQTAPLRWVGRRSYGLYLWHWPVFVLLAAALPAWPRVGGPGWALGGIAAAVTVVAAALSYRFVEQPIRRAGFGASLRRFAGWWRSSWRTAVGAGAVTVLVLAAGTGSVLAIASDPGASQTQLQVEAGQQAIAQAQSAPPSPTPSASATALGGDQISAIGDSVTLAAAPELEAQLPGIAIDAAVSRQMSAAPGIVQAELNDGTLRKVVILALGTNGPIQRSTLEQVRALMGPQRDLVLVTTQAPRGWTDGVNATLAAFARSYRNVELADWHEVVQPHLGELNRDQIHFGGAGARLFTGVIHEALQRLTQLPPPRDEQDDLSLPVPV